MSLVRQNLLTQPGYTPYCGANVCRHHWPRTAFTGTQFRCKCGWESTFQGSFISDYKAAQARLQPKPIDITIRDTREEAYIDMIKYGTGWYRNKKRDSP